MNIPDIPGSYLIIGRLDNDIHMASGHFKGSELLRGYYGYSGSACGPGGLFSRISRHLIPDTKRFWHFDHLKASLNFVEILFSVGSHGLECEVIKEIQQMEEVTFPIPKFGASDCSNRCPAHLFRLPLSSEPGSVIQKLNDRGFDLNRLILT